MILGDTYSTMVFLGNYPVEQLPYFYLAMGVFSFLVTQGVNPWVKSDLARFIKVSHVVIIILLLVLNNLISTGLSWAPFLFTITLATISMIANTSYWNSVAEMFDLREYKHISHLVTACSTLGGIVTGIATPLMLKFFSQNSLMVFYLLIIFSVIPLIQTIKFRKQGIKLSSDKPSVVIGHYGLLTALFISIVMMVLLFTCADFILKYQLAKVYSEQEIGSFLAPFYASVMTITVLAQYFISPIMVRKTGVTGMMLAFPLLLLLGCLLMVWQQNLYTAITLGAFAQIGRYSFYNVSKQLALNVLPRQLRRATNFQLQSIGRNGAIVLASIGLSYIAYTNSYSLLVWMMIFLCIIMFVNVYPLKKAYYQTLEQAINIHRFVIDFFSSQATDEAMRANVVEYAFNQNSTDSIIFGLSLLNRKNLKKIPRRVLSYITHDSTEIQGQVLSLLRLTKDKTAIDYLMTLLQTLNPSSELTWRITDVILGLDASQFLAQAEQEINSEFIPVKSRAISAYLLAGKASEQERSKALLFTMLKHPELEQRRWAVKVLRVTKIKVDDNLLIELLQDTNINLRLDAIDVVVHNARENTINQLTDLLFSPQTRVRATQALVAIGELSLDSLSQKINPALNPVALRMIIDVIAQIPSYKAEQLLVNLLTSGHSYVSMLVAYHLLLRIKNFRVSQLSHDLIEDHIMHMMIIMNSLLHAKQQSGNDLIIFEVKSYIYRLRRTFLLLLAVWSEDDLITKSIPILLNPNQDQQRFAKTIELLELRMTSPKIKKWILHFVEAKSHNKDIAIIPLSNIDSWFNQVERYSQQQLTGAQMERVHRMLVLRKISLFENLSSEAIQMIAENVQKIDASEGETLFNQGDLPEGLYILVKGHVDMKKGDQIIASYEGPDFFGELALFGNRARAAAAITTSDAELFLLDKAAFEHVTDEWPEILRGVVNKILTYIDY